MLIMYLVRKTREQEPFYFGFVICVSMLRMGGGGGGGGGGGVTAKGCIKVIHTPEQHLKTGGNITSICISHW